MIPLNNARQKCDARKTRPVHRTGFGQNNFPYLSPFFSIPYLNNFLEQENHKLDHQSGIMLI